jgi:hypothetical protein
MKKDDDQLDRLLRRAARTGIDRGPRGECLDPETLAAWIDGTLSPVQRSAAEAHAADCERCLALLAAMAQTAPPPSVARAPRWSLLRWAVPLATAAVAITVWTVLQQPPLIQSPERDEPAPSAATVSQPVEQEKKEAPPAAPPTVSSGLPPAPPGARAEKPSVERRAAEAQAPAAPLADARGDARDLATAQRFAAAAPLIVSSPDPNILWRSSNRRIERSIDAGRTWSDQRPEADADILAGAAPNENVCWMVGRTGLILLTTDGTTWRRITFPDAAATLVRVTATDGFDATVSTSDGRTYRTTDGGRTWTLQENPEPAF